MLNVNYKNNKLVQDVIDKVFTGMNVQFRPCGYVLFTNDACLIIADKVGMDNTCWHYTSKDKWLRPAKDIKDFEKAMNELKETL